MVRFNGETIYAGVEPSTSDIGKLNLPEFSKIGEAARSSDKIKPPLVQQEKGTS